MAILGIRIPVPGPGACRCPQVYELLRKPEAKKLFESLPLEQGGAGLMVSRWPQRV